MREAHEALHKGLEVGCPALVLTTGASAFPGDMGEYALYLGDGLAIHGTRDQSSVGRAASHGCMRLSKVGIATVYPLVTIGTNVIITSSGGQVGENGPSAAFRSSYLPAAYRIVRLGILSSRALHPDRFDRPAAVARAFLPRPVTVMGALL